MSIKGQIEDVTREFFEVHLWGSPKQILKFAVPRLQNRYGEDSARRLIFRKLKKWYIRHPYFPIYFSKEYDLKLFNLLLRLGWFKIAFEAGNKEPPILNVGVQDG
ncbi:MAG: hypothetical protein QXU45_01900 [Candidatus Bathyarchaeia archaeon]